MKRVHQNIFLVLFLLLSLILVGCGGGTTPEPEKVYNEANYTLTMTPTFEKELTVDEVKAALTAAKAQFAAAKSYSYSQEMRGEYNSPATYQGVTKIDVSGSAPQASIELTGTTAYAFYIANGKAYLNYNGYKTAYEVSANLSDLVEKTQESLGAFVSFDANAITADSLVFAGVDKDEATVVKYQVSEGASVIIVIHKEKIMKVLYSNDDSMEYIAKYDYNPVTITLPSDLDSYILK